MTCGHCLVAFYDVWTIDRINNISNSVTRWEVHSTTCPNCKEPTVKLKHTINASQSYAQSYSEKLHPVYPHSPRRVPIGDAVPPAFKGDYEEACAVLSISPKASAALSRRVLQAILKDQGYESSNLAKQIESVLSETSPDKVLPAAIRDTIDAVRTFGNFAAHPITDKTSLQIIDVEPNEAEWCLDIIETLFEHYYVRPAETRKKLGKLNEKMARAGKPSAKA